MFWIRQMKAQMSVLLRLTAEHAGAWNELFTQIRQQPDRGTEKTAYFTQCMH